MGTSKSYGGPRDRVPLLPSWATSQQAPGGGGALGGGAAAPAQAPATTNNGHAAPSAAPQQTAPANWQAAKTALGKAAARPSSGGARRGGGGGGRARSGIRRAAASYVRARGGSQAASRSSRSARIASGGLGGFLSDVATRGISDALRELGLSAYEGRDADTVFAAIANALAPAGESREAAAARQATNQALDQLYGTFVSETGDVSRLEAMTRQDVVDAIQASVSGFIFNRWVSELGIKVEQRTVTPAQAVQFERDMRLYVNETVRLDFTRIDPLKLDWKGAPGQAFVDRIYAEAYAVVGGEK